MANAIEVGNYSNPQVGIDKGLFKTAFGELGNVFNHTKDL
jgi:hypothetical protein